MTADHGKPPVNEDDLISVYLGPDPDLAMVTGDMHEYQEAHPCECEAVCECEEEEE